MPAPTRRRSRWLFLTQLLATVAGAAAVAVVVHTHVLGAFTIPSGSMAPTLAVGDQIVVDKVTWRGRGLERGDVVVFDGAGSFGGRDDHTFYVKRVLGLPGDIVACCDPAGAVTVNMAPVDEPYVHARDVTGFGPVTVPAGHLFVAGDHRSTSFDSRLIGTVPQDAVVGRAFAISWPLDRVGVLAPTEG